MYLCAVGSGATEWRWLSDLESGGVPASLSDSLRQLTRRVDDACVNASRMRQQGQCQQGQYQQLVRHLEEQRAQLFSQYESTDERHCEMRRELSRRRGAALADAARPPASPPANSPVEVRHIEGKGIGLVAARDIEAGERILCEAPLAVWHVPAAVEGGGGRALADPAQLEALLAALTQEDRAAFLELCDVHTAHGASEAAASAIGIWRSNAFTIHEGDSLLAVEDGLLRAAVFRTSSRLNHSCAPVCHAAWNPSVRMQTVHALKALPRGTELTIAYLGDCACMGRPKRQSELATRYRFDCTCEACSQCGEMLDSSEARRRRIAQLSKVIFDAPPPRQTALAEELCALTEAEGLPVVWQRLAIIAAMKAAKELGNIKLALRWAERGAKGARLGLGADAPATTTFDMVARVFQREIASGRAR